MRSHAPTRPTPQSCVSGYVANTDNALLKFKFAHLNSVDFLLEVEPGAQPQGGQVRS